MTPTPPRRRRGLASLTKILTLLAAMTAAACGSGSDSFASGSGTYARCYFSSTNEAGDPSTSGTLTLSASDGSTVASYSGEVNLPAFSVTLSPTSDTSATLSPAGQTFMAAWGYCLGGVSSNGGIPSPAPATGTVTLSSGALTFDESTAFLSLVGTLDDVQGSAGCPVVIGGPTSVSVAISCQVSGQVSP